MMFRTTVVVAALVAAAAVPVLGQGARKAALQPSQRAAQAQQRQALKQQQQQLKQQQQLRQQQIPPTAGQLNEQALVRLQAFLNLDASQTSELRALVETRQQELDAVVTPDKAAIQNLLQQPNANPADVANAKLTVRRFQQEQQAVQERFTTAFTGMLSPDQLTVYDGMIKAADYLAAFRALGLIGGPGK